MNLKEQLVKLANETGEPCVTITINTHRTHPENAKDEITLKNAVKEAITRVEEEFGKRPAAQTLEKLETLHERIDFTHNLDSLHIFISNDTEEIIKSALPSTAEGVRVDNTFFIRPLIKETNRSEHYMILLASQNGAHLYEAINNGILKEIKNDDFPFSENKHTHMGADKSDSKHMDDMLKEYFNQIDKAVVNVHNQNDLNVMVVCTTENYSLIQEVADRPQIYLGHTSIDHNHTNQNQLAAQSYEFIKEIQHERRAKAIEEVQEAVAHGKLLTDIQEIYEAAKFGRGELLIINENYTQPAMLENEQLTLIDDATAEGAIDDITSVIAWEVISKKGRVVFTSQEQLDTLGKIVLKTRY